MSVGQGAAGSQAGQQGSAGSQAGQQSTSQGQQGSAGSQAGQQGQQGNEQQQQQEVLLPGMLEGETLAQAFERVNGALATSRKQAAGYRQRIAGTGDDGGSQGNQQQQQGQGSGQQGNQQQQQSTSPEAQRIARLETLLLTEQQARRSESIARQLTNALVAEGAINPELTLRLIDVETLEVGDDGKVIDPAGAARLLKSQLPQVFGDLRGSGDGGAGGGNGAPLDFNAMIRRKAGY